MTQCQVILKVSLVANFALNFSVRIMANIQFSKARSLNQKQSAFNKKSICKFILTNTSRKTARCSPLFPYSEERGTGLTPVPLQNWALKEPDATYLALQSPSHAELSYPLLHRHKAREQLWAPPGNLSKHRRKVLKRTLWTGVLLLEALLLQQQINCYLLMIELFGVTWNKIWEGLQS